MQNTHKTQINETIWPTAHHQHCQHHTTCSPSSAILRTTIIDDIGNPPISTENPTNSPQNPSSLSSYSPRCSSPRYPMASSRRDRLVSRLVSRRDRLSDSVRERERMREAWQWQETERGDERAIIGYCSKRERSLNGLKYIKLFWHSATVPSHMWDGTVALCQKNLVTPRFSHPIAELILGLYAKCTLHLAFDRPIADALRIWLSTILGSSMLFVFCRGMWCKKMCNII